MTALVCTAHGSFVPCSHRGTHYTTANPYWVKAVLDYLGSTIEGLTWEPAVPADRALTNGHVWAEHGHPRIPCSPPEAVRGELPCRATAVRPHDVSAENLRVFLHEAETPMRGHDGYCCVRARLGLTASAALDTLDADPDASAVATWEQAVTAELVASTLPAPVNPARAILNALADTFARPLLWIIRRLEVSR